MSPDMEPVMRTLIEDHLGKTSVTAGTVREVLRAFV